MQRRFFTTTLPLLLFCLFAIGALFITIHEANKYAVVTVDNGLQDKYGQLTLAWYKSHGRDLRFMTDFNKKTYMPQHGPVFETIVAEAELKFGNPLYTRALVTGLAGFAGVMAIALCGFELGGWWGALLAAAGLWLYPRFFGTMFNNSKDDPFASSMTFMLWSVLLLVRNWNKKWAFLPISVLVGFFIGFSASIRVTAIFCYPMLGCLCVGWWIYNGRYIFKRRMVVQVLVKPVIAACLIVGASFITMIVCWPYVALHPLHNLYDAIVVNSKYPWNGVVYLNGNVYPATHVPRYYVPEWLAVGSPPAILFLTIIGSFIIGLKLLRRQAIQLPALVVALAFFFPFIGLIALRPALYNALRQFLFLVPPMILLAVYGFMQIFNYLRQRRQTLAMIGLVLVLLVSQLFLLKDTYDLYPYEYTYLSPLIGGTQAGAGKYDTEYEGLCAKASTDWLALNYKQYTTKTFPTLGTSLGSGQVTAYYPSIFKPGDRPKPDFYIDISQTYMVPRYPSYKLIHTVTIEGFVACQVEAK